MADGFEDEKDFNWLRRTSRGDSYVSYSAFSDFSACSFEFGHSGYAACCNYGGQLLQLSAPSPDGVSFVKGAFSDSIYAFLARAQRDNGGQCTFGIEVATDLTTCELSSTQSSSKSSESHSRPENSHFRLGQMLERGCFNYRWPLHEYSLVYKEKPKGGGNWPLKEGKEIGTCILLSFIEKGTLYQVMRLDQKHGAENAPEGKIRLNLGGIVQFRQFNLETFPSRDKGEKTNAGVDTFESEVEDVAANTEQSGTNRNSRIGTTPFKCFHITDESGKNAFQARLYQYDSNRENNYVGIELYNSEKKGDMGTAHSSGHDKWTGCYAHLPLFYQESLEAAVFVAAFRIVEVNKMSNNPWNPDLPDSSVIRRYVGANPNDTSSATGFLWDTIFFKHCLPRNYLSQIAEIRLVGRTLEKILHVDMMPDKSRNCATLISNLFLEPDVDYKSIFWKVRFLVKVYGFLWYCAAKDVSNDLTASTAIRIRSIAEYQCGYIRTCLEKLIVFLIQQLSDRESSLFEKHTKEGKDKSSIYYVPMTIWYVIKHQEPFKSVEFLPKKVVTNIDYLSKICPDYEDFSIGNKDKIPFLQWYHYGSIRKLEGAISLKLDLKHDITQLEKAALNVSAGKLSSKRPYSANDEIIDRLSFLAHELGLETIDYRRVSVASLAARRVRRRDNTRYLSPGSLEPDEEGFTDGFTDGPWEIYALCHHSRLAVVLLESYNVEELNLYKEKICQFLNSEATLVACWERSHLKARKAFIHSEASSVFGSTLLDIHKKSLEHMPYDTGDEDSVKSSNTEHTGNSFAVELHKPAADLAPPIEWTETWRLPRQYHPDNFLESLDDTPELYQKSHLKSTSINPSLKKYITEPTDKSFQNFTRNYLQRLKQLNWIRVVDIVDMKGYQIKNKVVFTDNSTTSTGDGPNELVKKLHDSLVDLDVRHRFLVVTCPPPRKKEELQDQKRLLDTLVYVLCPHSASCLSNHFLKLSRFSFRNRNDWVALITIVSWEMIPEGSDDVSKNDTASRGPIKSKEGYEDVEKGMTPSTNTSKESAASSTSDHMPQTARPGEEDQDFCNRMDLPPISVPRNLKSLIEAMQSGDKKVQSDDKMLQPNDERKKRRQGYLTKNIFKPQVSSFVLATNAFGDFSKCTIFSQLLKDSDLKVEIADRAERLWREFVHQPQTGRCLVFLQVLQVITRKVIGQYRRTLTILLSVLDLDDYLSQRVKTWSKDSHAECLFQLRLWSLEALYQLQRPLKPSIESVKEAKEQLCAQIKEGPGRRSEQLEKFCQRYIDSFESCFAELMAVAGDIERVIDLNSRNKDAFEAILTLADSRASLAQNRTMERLTYPTIVYLPVGLMAAIFAIPETQKVVLQPMGRGWFIGSIIIMLAATAAFAAYIEDIIILPKRLRKWLAKGWK